MVRFAHWFFKGTGAKPGIRKILNLRLLFHFIVGYVVFLIVPVDLKSAGNTGLLPLTGILVGLAFAWGGNAQALLQTPEIEALAKRHPGGFEEYIFSYQLAIFLILTALCSWGLAGLGVFDQPSPFSWGHRLYPVAGTMLYGIASLAIQECWSVVRGAQLFLMMRNTIRKARDN